MVLVNAEDAIDVILSGGIKDENEMDDDTYRDAVSVPLVPDLKLTLKIRTSNYVRYSEVLICQDNEDLFGVARPQNREDRLSDIVDALVDGRIPVELDRRVVVRAFMELYAATSKLQDRNREAFHKKAADQTRSRDPALAEYGPTRDNSALEPDEFPF